MTRKRLYFIAGAVLAAVLGLSLRRAAVKRDSSPQRAPKVATQPTDSSVGRAPLEQATSDTAVRRTEAVNKIDGILKTPITFYGRVIDQNGDPVPSADVFYGVLDRFATAGATNQTRTQPDGTFTIKGARGAVLQVGVRREGYYMIDGESASSFAYGVSPDENTKSPPTQFQPAVFKLRKRGFAESLIKLRQNYRIPHNGVPVQVDLSSGKISSSGDLRVEAWTSQDLHNDRGHYDWRCRISILNGGLVLKAAPFEFQAPTDGYRCCDEMVMPRTATDWQPTLKREYFLQLANGRYARMQFEIFAGGDHFFTVEAYVNPTPGSRNLEFDPAKQIASDKK